MAMAAKVMAMAAKVMARKAMAAKAMAMAAKAMAARAVRAKVMAAEVMAVAVSLPQSLSCRFRAIHHTREYPRTPTAITPTITLPQKTNGGIAAI